jgi:hypothetical protein
MRGAVLMAELTKEDIQILMEGVEAWSVQRPDVAKVVADVLGLQCPCPVCTSDQAGLIERTLQHRGEITRPLEEQIQSRKERAVVLSSKLIAMRDSIVADEFFASIKVQ